MNGHGVFTVTDARFNDSGAYSCEAINTIKRVFAVPDTIVTVVAGSILIFLNIWFIFRNFIYIIKGPMTPPPTRPIYIPPPTKPIYIPPPTRPIYMPSPNIKENDCNCNGHSSDCTCSGFCLVLIKI